MKFSWPVRVYYEDTDSGGVVYYANYLKFFERARTEFLRQYGIEQDQLIENENVIFAVRKITADYIKPAQFNDLLSVESEVTEIKNASLVFSQKILRADEICCQAECKIACLTADTLKPRKIPQQVFDAIHE